MLITSPCVVTLTWRLQDTLGNLIDELADPLEFFFGGNDLLEKVAPNAEGVYELTLEPTEFVVDGKRQCGRAYNGMYPAPTIDTAAASGGQKRQVRVNVKNAFTKSDYHSLHGTACTCTDTASMMSCSPDEAHDPGSTCVCTDADGMMCHLFDFNVTNLHAHGSHVRPDYATGGGCVEKDGRDQ